MEVDRRLEMFDVSQSPSGLLHPLDGSVHEAAGFPVVPGHHRLPLGAGTNPPPHAPGRSPVAPSHPGPR